MTTTFVSSTWQSLDIHAVYHGLYWATLVFPETF